MKKITHISGCLKYCLLFYIIISIIFTLMISINPNFFSTSFITVRFWYEPFLSEKIIFNTLSFSERMIFLFITGIHEVCFYVVLYFLYKLFSQFQKQNIFLLLNYRYLILIGTSLFLNQLFQTLAIFIINYYLTIKSPKPKYYLHLPDLNNLFFAALTVLIAWILHEGYKQKEENSLTI